MDLTLFLNIWRKKPTTEVMHHWNLMQQILSAFLCAKHQLRKPTGFCSNLEDVRVS